VKKFKLTILTTTDIHGYIFPEDYSTKESVEYGLAKISTMIKRIRKSREHVLYFDDGDSIQGSPLEYYHATVDNSSVDPTIKALNYMKCDGMTIGNHEFNFGRNVLEKAISEAEFTFTSANIVDKKTQRPKYGRGYSIFEFKNGPKVAYLSLTTKYIPFWEEPKYINDLDFLDPIEVAREYLKKFKLMGVDLVIIGYHGGLERDPESGEIIAELTGENQGYEMAQSLKGVSAFIFGHQHKSFATKINGVPLVMAASYGKALGVIEFELSYVNKWEVRESSVQLLSPAGIPPDKELLEIEMPYQILVENWLDEVIGEATGDFYVPDAMYARTHETALINLINDVQLYYSKADISATSVFTPNIHGWKKGPITRRDVMGVYVFSNTLKVFELTGEEVKEMVEHSSTYFSLKNGVVVESGKMKGYKYNIFKGISYTIDLEKPEGQRVIELKKNGKPLKMKKKYTIAVNSYQAGGSGGYTMFIGKKPIKEINVEVADLIVSYIKEKKHVSPKVENNWKILQVALNE
jgi:2',3'-cyclic-nucleotide 2'-phosphodiesterase/3'-nucleotidase